MRNAGVSTAVRLSVESRAAGCCEYCLAQSRYASDPFTIDHILPISRGGSNASENLAFSCSGCNGRKHAAIETPDPVTGIPTRLFNPRLDRWSDHFRWNEDFDRMIPLTSSGRATVNRLALNRPGLVELRRVLRNNGVHPPATSQLPDARI